MSPSTKRVPSMLVMVLALACLLAAFTNGPPPGVSGAPGDADCTACHDTFALDSGPGSVSIDAPAFIGHAASVPVMVTINNPQTVRNGFQMSVQDSLGTLRTGLQAATADLQATGSFHVNHTGAGTLQASWTTSWSPPAGMPGGPATFYAAGNATNDNHSSNGDLIYTGSRTIYRSGLTSSSTSWQVGQTWPLTMEIAPGNPGVYICVAALDTTPVPLGGPLIIPINVFDPFVDVAFSLPTIFQNLVGGFDATGTPFLQPQVAVPYEPGIAGLTLHFAYATLDLGVTQVTDVSNLFSATLAP